MENLKDEWSKKKEKRDSIMKDENFAIKYLFIIL